MEFQSQKKKTEIKEFLESQYPDVNTKETDQ